MSTDDYQEQAEEYVKNRYPFDEDTQQFRDMVDKVKGQLEGEDGQQEIGDLISDLSLRVPRDNKAAIVVVAALALVGGVVAAFKIIRRAWNRRAQKPKK